MSAAGESSRAKSLIIDVADDRDKELHPLSSAWDDGNITKCMEGGKSMWKYNDCGASFSAANSMKALCHVTKTKFIRVHVLLCKAKISPTRLS